MVGKFAVQLDSVDLIYRYAASTEFYTLSLHDALPIFGTMSDVILRMQKNTAGNRGMAAWDSNGNPISLSCWDERKHRRPQTIHAKAADLSCTGTKGQHTIGGTTWASTATLQGAIAYFR